MNRPYFFLIKEDIQVFSLAEIAAALKFVQIATFHLPITAMVNILCVTTADTEKV